MTEEAHEALEAADQAHKGAAKVLAKLISVASADRVYSEPVVAGDKTIITAAEIRTGMGFGYGLAGVAAPAGRMTVWPAEHRHRDGRGPRGGGGGGGQAVARPVAVVTIDSDGVDVQPILDRTRIILTALTALGAIGLMLIKLRHATRRETLRLPLT